MSTGSEVFTIGSTGNVTCAGNVLLQSGSSASELRLYEPSGSGTNYTAFKAQAQAGDVTYTLPAADGSNGQALITNGSGTLSWSSVSGSYLALSGGTLTGDLTITKTTAASLRLNATDTISYSAVVLAENSVDKAYVEYINSAFTTSARRNYLEIYNVVGGVALWANNNKRLDISSAGAIELAGAVTMTSTLTTAGNLNVSYSNASGEVYGAITNTSSAAANCHATLYLITTASTGGNSQIRLSNSGHYDWTFGCDNVNSNMFKISESTALGTNDRFRIGSSGDTTILGDLTIARSSQARLYLVDTAGTNSMTAYHNGSHGYIETTAGDIKLSPVSEVVAITGGLTCSKLIRQTSEPTSTPTGTTSSITLNNGNHQSLVLTSATGAVTVTLTVPSTSSAGTIIVKQHATTVRDLTWAVSAGSLVWIGAEPNWGADAVSEVRIVAWRYNGATLYLSATEVNT
jgi:hypothetical protein